MWHGKFEKSKWDRLEIQFLRWKNVKTSLSGFPSKMSNVPVKGSRLFLSASLMLGLLPTRSQKSDVLIACLDFGLGCTRRRHSDVATTGRNDGRLWNRWMSVREQERNMWMLQSINCWISLFRLEKNYLTGTAKWKKNLICFTRAAWLSR